MEHMYLFLIFHKAYNKQSVYQDIMKTINKVCLQISIYKMFTRLFVKYVQKKCFMGYRWFHKRKIGLFFLVHKCYNKQSMLFFIMKWTSKVYIQIRIYKRDVCLYIKYVEKKAFYMFCGITTIQKYSFFLFFSKLIINKWFSWLL